MGTKSLFRCIKCQYEAKVSGGKDCGFHAEIETMICANCRALVDVLVSLDGKTSSSDIGLCPECSARNVKSWDSMNKPCPRCDGSMEQGPVIMMWD